MIVNNGTLNATAEAELNKTAIALGLDANEGTDLIGQNFMREFNHIQQRIESTFVMTDRDMEEIERLKIKYNTVKLTMQGNAGVRREAARTNSD